MQQKATGEPLGEWTGQLCDRLLSGQINTAFISHIFYTYIRVRVRGGQGLGDRSSKGVYCMHI